MFPTISCLTARSEAISPSSQIYASNHEPKVVELLDMQVTDVVKDYILDIVVDAVSAATKVHPSLMAGELKTRSLSLFINNLVANCGAGMREILVALVYVQRLQLVADCHDYVGELVITGALVLAYKYLHDYLLSSTHWVAATSNFFTLQEINRITREFVFWLDFDTKITDEDLLGHYAGLMRTHHLPPIYWMTSVFKTPEVSEHQTSLKSSRCTAPSSRYSPYRREESLLPDLAYPESPCSSDQDSPAVTTPSTTDPHYRALVDKYAHGDPYCEAWYSGKGVAPNGNPYCEAKYSGKGVAAPRTPPRTPPRYRGRDSPFRFDPFSSSPWTPAKRSPPRKVHGLHASHAVHQPSLHASRAAPQDSWWSKDPHGVWGKPAVLAKINT